VEFLQPPQGHEFAPAPAGPIRCHAVEERSLYVSATGRVLPCCFIGADVFRLSAELEAYIQQPGYQNLVESWKSTPPAVCRNNCAVQDSTTRFHSQWREDIALC
jgi:hypothetical protein